MRNVMTPERWQQVDHLLEAMLDLDRASRSQVSRQRLRGRRGIAARSGIPALCARLRRGLHRRAPAREVAELFNGSPKWLVGGEVLGHYKVIEMLGAGGMGEIYLAEDNRLGRRVALKLLPAHFTWDASRLRRFEQEARAASALSHPNVCTIHEVGKTDDNRHYIVMEYVEGDTLQEHVANRQIKIKETLDISIQIASALQAAHEAGVVHRDIKPANVMVRGDGYVKVLDFGLAKLTERQAAADDAEAPTRELVRTESGIVMGTASHMSPEQARGLPLDARTDVWSLGVVLYEMVAGRLPFTGETMADLLVAIVEKDPPPLTSQTAEAISAKLDRIITKALSKDRETRYQTSKELLVDLRQLRQQMEIDSHLGRSAEPAAAGAQAAQKRVGFITRRASVMAIVLMAILVGAIAYLWPWGKNSVHRPGRDQIARRAAVRKHRSRPAGRISLGRHHGRIDNPSSRSCRTCAWYHARWRCVIRIRLWMLPRSGASWESKRSSTARCENRATGFASAFTSSTRKTASSCGRITISRATSTTCSTPSANWPKR